MRLSFYTYSYTDRLKLPVAEVLAQVAKTGYAGIDESGTYGASDDPHSINPARRIVIRETAAANKLRIEAIITHAELTTGIAEGKPLDLIGSVDLAADLGSPIVTFHLGGPQEKFKEKELWQKTVAHIKAACTHGDMKHVKVAIDVGPWPTWIVKTSDDLMRLISDVGSDSFSINYDPCYLQIMGIDPVRFAKRFASRICHVHLKDHTGEYPKFEMKIPGQGKMDYAPILAALAEEKFGGALAIECFTFMKFEEACDVGYATLGKAATKAKVKFESRPA